MASEMKQVFYSENYGGNTMNIKERFLDYWNTDLVYDDYKYDITIFEQIIYVFIGAIGGIVAFIVILSTFPLWCLPYLFYKTISCTKRKMR